MRESQPSRIGNGFAQRRIASDFNRSPRQPKFRENDWGCVRSVRNCVRVEHSCSAKAPEEHLSTSILEARAPAGQILAEQSFSSRVTLYCSTSRIESRYPMIGTHP